MDAQTAAPTASAQRDAVHGWPPGPSTTHASVGASRMQTLRPRNARSKPPTTNAHTKSRDPHRLMYQVSILTVIRCAFAARRSCVYTILAHEPIISPASPRIRHSNTPSLTAAVGRVVSCSSAVCDICMRVPCYTSIKLFFSKAVVLAARSVPASDQKSVVQLRRTASTCPLSRSNSTALDC